MYFTYDLLGSYLISKHLVEQAADDVQGFINSEEAVALLFGEDYQTLHPMHEDIVQVSGCTCTNRNRTIFLHELPDNKKDIRFINTCFI